MLIYDLLDLPNSYLVEQFEWCMDDEGWEPSSYCCRWDNTTRVMPKVIQLRVTADYSLPMNPLTQEFVKGIRANITLDYGGMRHWDGQFSYPEYKVRKHDASGAIALQYDKLCFESFGMELDNCQVHLADQQAFKQLRAKLRAIAKKQRFIICSNKQHLLFLKA